jgi:hypothetical protein
MDIPLFDPSDAPRPPGEVRFRSLVAEPYPDGRRIRLKLSITPFLERPNIEIELRDPQGLESGAVAVIESMDSTLSMTLHLRDDPQSGDYRAVATLGYPDHGTVDAAEVAFTLPRPPSETAG